MTDSLFQHFALFYSTHSQYTNSLSNIPDLLKHSIQVLLPQTHFIIPTRDGKDSA